MKILGIDPGLVNTGFGIVSYKKTMEAIDYGTISPDKHLSLSARLHTIYSDTKVLIEKYSPDCLSIEEVFYSNNVKTTMKLGQARGAVLIAAADFNLAFIAIITAISTAFAFMTSFGTPPNLIVQASGIPTSNDFLRNGVPLVIIAILFLVLAQTYYWEMASEVAGI